MIDETKKTQENRKSQQRFTLISVAVQQQKLLLISKLVKCNEELEKTKDEGVGGETRGSLENKCRMQCLKWCELLQNFTAENEQDFASKSLCQHNTGGFLTNF